MNHDNIEEIKRIELNILDEFAKVCDKLDVKYFLAYGTMIGAIRHKGFIPWDDDIDVVMMREDYEKFINQAQALLPENLFLQNYKTDKNFLLQYSKIRDNNTTFIEQSQCKLDINHGIFIDIFPLDYCYDANDKTKKLFKRIKFKCSLLSPFFSPITDRENGYGFAKKTILKLKRMVQRILFALLYGSKKNTGKLLEDIDKIKMSVPKGKNVSVFDGFIVENKDWFNECAEYEFEGKKYIGVKDYHSYLTQIYGDYMQLPPEEKCVPQHYTTIIDTGKSYKEYI